MNRKPAVLLIALASMSAWLVSTSACSGGGESGIASDDDPGTTPASAVTDAAPLDDPSPSSGEISPPSPFDTGTPSDAAPPSGDGGDTGADIDASSSATDDGPELQRPIGDGTDTASIAGLWDYSRVTERGTDVVLFSIDDDGGLTEYDFQGDAVGSGNDCYVLTRASIAVRSDDRYDIQDSSTLPGSDSIDDVLITADAAEITFRYLGTSDDPQFGGNMSGITERYPAAAGRAVGDLVPCTT